MIAAAVEGDVDRVSERLAFADDDLSTEGDGVGTFGAEKKLHLAQRRRTAWSASVSPCLGGERTEDAVAHDEEEQGERNLDSHGCDDARGLVRLTP